MDVTSEAQQNRAAAGTYLIVLPWEIEGIGGVNQVVAGLYAGLARFALLRPRVLVLSWTDALAVDKTDPAGRSITKARIRSPFAGSRLLPALLRYLLFLPGELVRLRQIVRAHDVRVVNCHYIGTGEFSWLIAKATGVFTGKVLLSVHGADFRTIARSTGVRRMLWSWALRNSDAVVACSEGLAHEVIQQFPRARRRVVTIHNGVDIEALRHEARAAVGDPAPITGRPALLNLGTFEHKKGHDVLLKAFARVVVRYPTARLAIMGRTAATKDSTVRLRADLGLDGHVLIQADVAHDVALRALQSADLFVLSSRNEAFCVALLEAGAFAVPVVATNVCGVPELIRDGESGFIVPSDNVDALAEGIIAALADSARTLGFGRRLQQVVAAEFTTQETARRYLRLAGYEIDSARTEP